MVLVISAFVVLMHPSVAPAANQITGRVIDENGNPVPQAAVIVARKQIGAMTDSTGNFRLTKVPLGPLTLRSLAVGYAPGEKQIRVTSEETVTVEIMLTRAPVAAGTSAVQSGAGPVPVYNVAYEPCDDLTGAFQEEQSLAEIGVRADRQGSGYTYKYKA